MSDISEVPPRYSSLSSQLSPVDLKYPAHEPRVDAPYRVGSRWRLVRGENAIPDEDDFQANLGVLHGNDFEKTKKYEKGTIVQIKEVGSRKYRVNDSPLHVDHALYNVYVLERNVPCNLPKGELFEIEGSQIKESRTSRDSLRRRLEVHDRAFACVDIPNGGPRKNTPIVICQAGLSISSKFIGKFTYKVRILVPAVRDMKYIIERDLVHAELQPVSGQYPSSTTNIGFTNKFLSSLGLRKNRMRGSPEPWPPFP